MFNIYFQSTNFTRRNFIRQRRYFNAFNIFSDLPTDSLNFFSKKRSLFIKKHVPYFISCHIINLLVNVQFWFFRLFKWFITIFNFISDFPIKPFLRVLFYSPFLDGRDLINYAHNFLNKVIICLINLIIVFIIRKV